MELRVGDGECRGVEGLEERVGEAVDLRRQALALVSYVQPTCFSFPYIE